MYSAMHAQCNHDASADLLHSPLSLSLSLSLPLSACAGCLGQGDIEFLTVDVVPVSISSVRASFTPPNATINYTVLYWFGDMRSEHRSGSEIVTGQGVQNVTLTDPMPTPGTRVEVQINSTLNLTYPITVASTCYPGKYIRILKKEYESICHVFVTYLSMYSCDNNTFITT